MKKYIKIFAVFVMSVLLLTGCDADVDELLSLLGELDNGNQSYVVMSDEGNLVVDFIDVGQADASLIKFPSGEYMMIDTGEKDSYDTVEDMLKRRNVGRIDYLIATHPHADHIGSMANVVKNTEIGSIYMPKASNNTKSYENLLNEIKKKGYKINTAKAGMTIYDDGNFKAEILAPNSDKYEGLNDYSVVVKMTYKDVKILFMGDAEVLSENEIMSKGFDVSADVLKVGHHGSSSSTGQEFLDKVNPGYAVIFCAQGNSYNHPHRETVEKLDKAGVKTYRTDINGTVELITDGDKISVKAEREK